MTLASPKYTLFLRAIRAFVVAILFAGGQAFAAGGFSVGDVVRLTRSEELLFKGQKFLSAPKAHEFTVLQHDLRQRVVYLPYCKQDGTLVAVTVPADAVESSPRDGWADLMQGVEAFRDQRPDEAKRLLTSAAKDPQYRALAASIAPRLAGLFAMTAQAARVPTAKQGAINALQGLRDLSEQLCKSGYYSLAQPIEEAADRVSTQLQGATPAVPGAAASKVDRADLAKRAQLSTMALIRSRQAVAVRHLMDASKHIEEGLQADPSRPELKTLQARVKKDVDEAEERHKAADSMRRFEKGAVHALTALERGLKLCADHPKLLSLRKEMQALFEERTAPPVTTAFLKTAGAGASLKTLEEGWKLYTTRCTECHDLDLLDSRSLSSWRTTVAGMARRANINDSQQARILEYLGAAQNGMDAN